MTTKTDSPNAPPVPRATRSTAASQTLGYDNSIRAPDALRTTLAYKSEPPPAGPKAPTPASVPVAQAPVAAPVVARPMPPASPAPAAPVPGSANPRTTMDYRPASAPAPAPVSRPASEAPPAAQPARAEAAPDATLGYAIPIASLVMPAVVATPAPAPPVAAGGDTWGETAPPVSLSKQAVLPVSAEVPPLSATASHLELGATIAVEDTVASDATAVRASLRASRGATTLTSGSAGRTTVLPRSAPAAVSATPSAEGAPNATWVLEPRPRYERKRLLGEGGNGEVSLEHDVDIDRVVAVKRLRKELTGDESLLRFADEVRVVGKLEHPNIVPVHDVGIDEQGSHYFVMKYVQGETLESIIDKLAAGDPAYLAKYTIERRATIATEIMHALSYAHAQGFVHRDLKPANVMVGQYGEVMVMDWGLARRVKGADKPLANDDKPAPDDASGTERDRMYRTRHGSLLGTPAYMAPEQARGQNDQVDERTDVYAMSVMIHELFFLRHYLSDKTTVGAILVAIGNDPDPPLTGWSPDLSAALAPPEYLHFVRKGLRKAPAERFQSMAEMLEVFTRTRSGDFAVQCPCTAIKQGTNGLNRVIDSHPMIGMMLAFVVVAFSLFGLGSAVWRIVT